MSKGYIYLASPYTDEDPVTQEERYLMAVRAFRHLTEQGKIVFSPIIHCHEIAKIIRLPGDHLWWKRYDETMILQSSEVVVLQCDGWQASKGVASEIAFAAQNGIPVRYL